MSTRSHIGVLNDDNSVDYIYVHFDGYPEHNGRILVENYNSEEKAKELIDLGDLSSLHSTLVETSKTVYNEPKSKASHYRLWLNRNLGNIPYIYMWKDNKWSCFRNSGDYNTKEINLYMNEEHSNV